MQQAVATGWAFDRLKRHLQTHHAGRAAGEQGALVGPDPSGRYNLRLGRFLRAAAPLLPGGERKVFLQSVGYWARLNGLQAALDDASETTLRGGVEASGEFLLARQAPDGSWPYADGSGRTATFDGTWAAVGLLEAFWATGQARYAHGSGRWIGYLVRSGTVQPRAGGQYVRYWSDRDLIVPNVSAELLWLTSEQAKATPDAELDELMHGLVRFLADAQCPSGELPYRVASGVDAARQHYLCFQYNAFEFLAIERYVENSGDRQAEPLLARLAEFLVTGVSPAGGCRTSCTAVFPEVDYYAAALALALRRAERLLGPRARSAADALVRWLLARQRPDGSFGYSRVDYGIPVLRDQQSYPRPLAIIAYTLAALGAVDSGRMQFERRGAGVAL